MQEKGGAVVQAIKQIWENYNDREGVNPLIFLIMMSKLNEIVKNIPDKNIVVGFIALCLCLSLALISYYLVYHTKTCVNIQDVGGEIEERCFEDRNSAIKYLKNKIEEDPFFYSSSSRESFNWSSVLSSNESSSVS